MTIKVIDHPIFNVWIGINLKGQINASMELEEFSILVDSKEVK